MDPNVDMLRHKIDEEAGGDKVPFVDPAAAPLGTDAEAGGSPPTAEEIRAAAKTQLLRFPGEMVLNADAIAVLVYGLFGVTFATIVIAIVCLA